MSDCGVRDSGTESFIRAVVCLSRRSLTQAAHLYCMQSPGRLSLPPSVWWQYEHQLSGWVIQSIDGVRWWPLVGVYSWHQPNSGRWLGLRVGSRLALFYIHQMNWVNSCMTLSWWQHNKRYVQRGLFVCLFVRSINQKIQTVQTNLV